MSFQDANFAFQGTGQFAFQTVAGVTPAVDTPAGGWTKPVRRRKRHYVEIDNKYYEVRDLKHAEEILARLHRKAIKPVKARAAAKRASEPEYVAPRISVVEPAHAEPFTQALQAKVDMANAMIEKTFREAVVAAAVIAAREAEEDEVAVILGML